LPAAGLIAAAAAAAADLDRSSNVATSYIAHHAGDISLVPGWTIMFGFVMARQQSVALLSATCWCCWWWLSLRQTVIFYFNL